MKLVKQRFKQIILEETYRLLQEYVDPDEDNEPDMDVSKMYSPKQVHGQYSARTPKGDQALSHDAGSKPLGFEPQKMPWESGDWLATPEGGIDKALANALQAMKQTGQTTPKEELYDKEYQDQLRQHLWDTLPAVTEDEVEYFVQQLSNPNNEQKLMIGDVTYSAGEHFLDSYETHQGNIAAKKETERLAKQTEARQYDHNGNKFDFKLETQARIVGGTARGVYVLPKEVHPLTYPSGPKKGKIYGLYNSATGVISGLPAETLVNTGSDLIYKGGKKYSFNTGLIQYRRPAIKQWRQRGAK